jgi:hypothetical protein
MPAVLVLGGWLTSLLLLLPWGCDVASCARGRHRDSDQRVRPHGVPFVPRGYVCWKQPNYCDVPSVPGRGRIRGGFSVLLAVVPGRLVRHGGRRPCTTRWYCCGSSRRIRPHPDVRTMRSGNVPQRVCSDVPPLPCWNDLKPGCVSMWRLYGRAVHDAVCHRRFQRWKWKVLEL